MNDRPDYDFSKHVKIPDEWIEKALAVPSTHAEEPHRVSQRSRRLAAAAGVMLVLGLSISLYFSFRNINNTSDAVAPSAVPTDAPTDAPLSSDVTDSPAYIENTSAPSLSPTRAHDTAAPSVSSSQMPASAPIADPTKSDGVPDHTVSVKPSTVPTPTTPTISPTVPSTASPTEPPHTVPSECVTLPTEQTSQGEEPHTESTIEVFIPFDFPAEATAASDEEPPYYCRLYNSAGVLIGDSDLFAESHRAYLVPADRNYYFYYSQTIVPTAYTSAEDVYEYVIYDNSGATLKRGRIQP